MPAQPHRPGPPDLPWAIPKWVAWGALLYGLAWSLLPPLLSSSFPLDVVESLTWGREWQWGYYKHPPLAPWVLHLFWLAFGAAGPTLLSQVCIALTLWFVWCTGVRLMTAERAFLGTALTMGVAFYTHPALEFNHNIAQMPLWAALVWCMLAALQTGRLRTWLMLGVLAGLGMLTKYSMGLILACLGLYLVLSPARRQLRGPGPWVALVTSLAVFAPHFYWLWQSGWLPLEYARHRAAADSGPDPHLSPVLFLGTQLLNHLPLALIVLVAALGTRRALQRSGVDVSQTPLRWRPHTAWPGYLVTAALAPGFLVTGLGLILGVRLRDMWGVPIWAFSGLWVAAMIPTAWLAQMRPRLLRGLVVWLLLVSTLSGLYLAVGAQWRHRPARTDWPAAQLGKQSTLAWQSASTCPLDTVAGDYWLAGLVTVASPGRPSVLIDADSRFSPWITPARLRAHGALWVWLPQPPGEPAAQPPALLKSVQQDPGMVWREGEWNIAWPYAPDRAALQVHWRAVVPMACAR